MFVDKRVECSTLESESCDSTSTERYKGHALENYVI